jgi:hypothetical protein
MLYSIPKKIIKGLYITIITSLFDYTSVSMDVVIDYEVLFGAGNEPVVKELSIAAKDVINTFHFRSPYKMDPHGRVDNGLTWEDGYIEYDKLQTVVSEVVANYARIYAYGIVKCQFLRCLTGRSVTDLEKEFNCPDPCTFAHECHCWLPCHRRGNVRCSTKTAKSLYDWLMYHFRTKSYIDCPQENTRHTASFLAGV